MLRIDSLGRSPTCLGTEALDASGPDRRWSVQEPPARARSPAVTGYLHRLPILHSPTRHLPIVNDLLVASCSKMGALCRMHPFSTAGRSVRVAVTRVASPHF